MPPLSGKKFALIPLLSIIFFSGFPAISGRLEEAKKIANEGEIVYPARIVYPVQIKRSTTSHSFQKIELKEIAENFDLIYCFPEYFGPKVQDLKTLNPELITLVYRNFRAIYETRISEYQMAFDNGWILKDSAGNIVRSTQWTKNVMADIGNPDYQDFVVNWIKETIDQYGYDGVFFDNSFSVRKLEMWFGLTAQPVNPRTGREWTKEEIKQACIQVHNKLKESVGPKLDVANGIFHGHRFWERYDDYVDLIANSPVDGFMSEGMWWAYNGRWFTLQEWCEALDFQVWIQDNFLTSGKLFWMDVTIEEGTLPAGCTHYQMIDYAFASSLLGARNHNNYVEFLKSYSRGDWFGTEIDYVQNLHSLAIGEPLSDYYRIEGTGVYARDFTNVKVLVNPTPDSSTINLGGSFKTLQGEEISVITLDNHTGVILEVSK